MLLIDRVGCVTGAALEWYLSRALFGRQPPDLGWPVDSGGTAVTGAGSLRMRGAAPSAAAAIKGERGCGAGQSEDRSLGGQLSS